MKKLILTVIPLALLLGGVLYFVNHHKSADQQSSNQLRVVTTNSILEDMVRQVAGDKVALHSIVARGVDPHEYEPKPTDISETTQADVIFHNGLNLETGGSGWFSKLIKTAHKKDREQVFEASDAVTPLYLTTNQSEQDPHAWLDLGNGIRYVETITAVLKAKDPKHANYYQERSDTYLAKLKKLDAAAKEKFLDIPEKQRLLVTSEGAFKYFSKAYHVIPAYIWEINTESQGTPEQMAEVLAKINASEVKALFVETSVSPKSMAQVSKETGLPIYSKIFTDSLAKKGEIGDTYYDMMKWNLDKIHQGLSDY
ncbi:MULTISPECIES: metal ABC transporter solute-binding protein, Zn/Mn family [Streptococcaceae]|uniref:Zinc ABC transporter solute-binding protein n=2 Tax=Bacilli TaxID=91061 RepID=A0A290QAQ0_9LACT|nr:zinc ABC transporter substrate-binding protein [Lactococcus raffinolactis]MBP6300678.1 zinc ABC transporter substrate-binding protein [Lactococcus sp.]ATC62388.1 metal ABC transporter substrate-binding protein [Lactococcus raffinolactis]MBP6984593.1 zinc ABC transporter substrate-binding protein [Lactococcus sp.]MBW9330584.1 metal ABC transporter substrate-binding protein [Lactococcus raffinolactis]MCH4161665.1 zinc ABC transporter substrate-binding protein [Lactococcus raffinolactis]